MPGPKRAERPPPPNAVRPFQGRILAGTRHRGLHPRLFMSKPSGLVGLGSNLPCKWLLCASRRRGISKLPVGCVRERGCAVLDQPQQLANRLRLVRWTQPRSNSDGTANNGRHCKASFRRDSTCGAGCGRQASNREPAMAYFRAASLEAHPVFWPAGREASPKPGGFQRE
jgi:hypothetical protein